MERFERFPLLAFFYYYYYYYFFMVVISGALAREARSGAPWVTKYGKLPIREHLVIT